MRSDRSSIWAALATDEWACCEHTISRRPVAVRAAIAAARVDTEAESSMWPCQPAGSPSRSGTQLSTTSSSSVAAGAVRQRIATALRVAASISARIAGGGLLVAK